MTTNRQALAREGLKLAIKLRQDHKIRIEDPISIFDFSEKLGIEVRFVDIPSMEGMYIKKAFPEIFISSHRPVGRQSYTCAHEIGHHLFQHGTHVDEISKNIGFDKRFNPEEFLADAFAGFLLMPKTTVRSGFIKRGWKPESCSPDQIYRIACWLGVGYSTIIHHMQVSLNLFTRKNAKNLLRVTPKSIQHEYNINHTPDHTTIPVDSFWDGRAIDIQIGDTISLPPSTQCEGDGLIILYSDRKSTLIQSTRVGICRVFNNDTNWSSFVRISRKDYVGLSRYRHLEEAEGD